MTMEKTTMNEDVFPITEKIVIFQLIMLVFGEVTKGDLKFRTINVP